MKSSKVVWLLITVFTLISCSTTKKNLVYGTWVCVKLEKKDGSRYVERNDKDKYYTTFKITPNSLNMILDNGRINTPYNFIGDSILKFSADNYKVKSVNDSILILLENDDERPSDKINKYVFVKEKYYKDYIYDHNIVDYVNDTTIKLNKYFFPFQTGKWERNIYKRYQNCSFDGLLRFEVILDSLGFTNQVKLIENNKVSKEVEQVIVGILKSESEWFLMPIKKKVYYKVNLVVNFSDLYSNNVYVQLDDLSSGNKYLSLSDISLSNKYYNSSLDFIAKNDFSNAESFLSRCIAIDSLYIDAYYNRAYLNYNLDQKDKSCIDWEFLYKQLGQKNAEQLFKEKCKKE